jgi:hypothetical protein
LGIAPDKVHEWSVSQFFDRWDTVAKFNKRWDTGTKCNPGKDLLGTPEKMVGEGIIPFEPLNTHDPRFRKGKRGQIHLPPILGGPVDPIETLF